MVAPRLTPDHGSWRWPPGISVRRATFLALLVFSTVLALTPRLQLLQPSGLDGYFDKFEHVLGFAVLTFIGVSGWRRRWALTGGLVCYAIILELAQGLVVGREVSLHDALASLAGVALGMALFVVVHRVSGWAKSTARPAAN